MNILFMNRNSGAGVEFEGNLFIDILSRVVGIDTINVYSSQCQQHFKMFEFSKYDLIILNDIDVNGFNHQKFDVDVPIININFGGTGNRSKVIDLIIDINIPYTFYYETYMLNYYPINFISGNIWKDYIKWEDRSDEILYVSRFSKEKIIPEFLNYVRSIDGVINFYGPIIDEAYYKSNRDIIDYKGYINHKELLKIYNNYKSIYLFSTTECLSMTLREAILCGTVPIVYDINNFTKMIEEYIILSNKNCSYKKEIIFSKHKKIEKDRKYLNNIFSFDKMVIDFIFCLRGLLLKNLKFDKNYKAKINLLHNNKRSCKAYINDTINWNNVKI